MSVITIEILREDEKEEVSRLLVESYSQYQNSYAEPEAWLGYAVDLASSVSNPLVDRFLVAKDEDEILGTLQLFENGETAYNNAALEIDSPVIRMLAVRPSARGKGIARTLLEEGVRYAREKGANHIYLHTSDKMAQAIRLYERFGFQRDRSKEFYKLDFLVKCYRFDIVDSFL